MTTTLENGAIHDCNTPDSNIVEDSAYNKLLLAIIACGVFMVVEFVGGYISGSLAIMTDAVHLLSDMAGFFISLFAIAWGKKPGNTSMSFGYHRAEILGALLSVSLVWIMTLFLLKEAITRLNAPKSINGKLMFWTAFFGAIVNTIIGFILHHDHEHHQLESNNLEHDTEEQPFLPPSSSNQRPENINIRAALIHVMGDLIQSFGVMITAGIIWLKPTWTIADPICTFVFSIFVLATTGYLARQSITILMEGSPSHLSAESLEEKVMNIPGVTGVHDIHIWTVAIGRYAASVHIVARHEYFKDISVYELLLKRCKEELCYFGIHHSTVQLDPHPFLDSHCWETCILQNPVS